MSNQRIQMYRLDLVDYQELYLPANANILHVLVQEGTPHLLAMIDEEEQSTYPRDIYIVPIGSPVPSSVRNAKYIGTVHLGTSVLNVFAYLWRYKAYRGS